MKYVIAPNTGGGDVPLSKEAKATAEDLSARYPPPKAIPATEFADRADERKELIDKGVIAKQPK